MKQQKHLPEFNISRVGCDENLSRITSIKFHIAVASAPYIFDTSWKHIRNTNLEANHEKQTIS